jgi:hypothetical protein
MFVSLLFPVVESEASFFPTGSIAVKLGGSLEREVSDYNVANRPPQL